MLVLRGLTTPPYPARCWKSTLNHKNEPVVKITPGCMVHSLEAGKQGWRFTASTTIAAVGVKTYRITGVLAHPDPYTNTVGREQQDHQWCHRCYNSPQPCCNPTHGYFGTDNINKSTTKCQNGAAFYCPHPIKCVFVDAQGIPIPCRNALVYPGPCTHVPNCHTILPGARV